MQPSFIRGCATVIALVGLACSASNGSAVAGPTPALVDGGSDEDASEAESRDAGARPPCGPANCSGCCNKKGLCVGGLSTTACGKNGKACAECAPPDNGNGKASCNVTCGFACDDGYAKSGSQCVRDLPSGWSDQASGTSSNLYAIWGSGAHDLYAVGADGTILHSTGDGSWSAQTSGTTSHLYGVWGSSAGDVYVVGDSGVILHSAGNGTWTVKYVGNDLRGVWGNSATDVYAVGDHGTIMHSTGGNFAAQTSGTTLMFYSVWGSGTHDVYVAGVSGISHSAGDGHWTSQTASGNRIAIWGSGSGDIYAGGNGYITGYLEHSTGDGTWTSQTPSNSIRALSGTSSNDVWAIDAFSVYHSTVAGTWPSQGVWMDTNAHSLLDIWATGPHDAYVVGEAGVILHYE
jgi:hypothetical protein